MSGQLQQLIGRRIRFARDQRGWTQALLSRKIGFKDRQTLSSIESGKRAVSADELVRFAEVLARPLEFFTDAFQLSGEAKFSWRAKEAEPGLLEDYEEQAGRWLAAYRQICRQRGKVFNPLTQQLNLNQRVSFEQAAEAGEALARSWNLGPTPAFGLHAAAERRLGLLVLAVEAPHSISGAACRLPEFNAILVNRQDPAGRRHFDFAHELFHLLTWNNMPPRHRDLIGAAATSRDKRTESLADNFAAGLLMPKEPFRNKWLELPAEDIHERIQQMAEAFGVTGQAVRYRAKNLRLLSLEDEAGIAEHRLAHMGPRAAPPPLFSKEFVEQLHWALDGGRLAVRKACRLLGMASQDLLDLFADHHLEAPFDI